MQRTANALIRWQALCGLVLIAVTWRLWWPASDFPRIPWIAWGVSVPHWVDDVACIVLIASLLALLNTPILRGILPSPSGRGAGGEGNASEPHRRRLDNSLVVCTVASLGLLVALDQHRLQPWAWQLLLWCAVFLATPATMLWSLRWLTVSIYFWSGVSKLDAAFPTTDGRVLVDGLTRSLAVDTRFWDEATLSNLASVFPWGELLAAIWLGGWMLVVTTLTTDLGEPSPTVHWPSRMLQIGGGLAIAMHLSLMLIVGPFGLDHEPAVLAWNVFFIGQAWLLFGRRDSLSVRAVQRGERTVTDRFITAFTLAAMGIPIATFWHHCDHWPAWAVYSARPEIVEVWIDNDAADRLPADLQDCLKPAPPLESRRELNLDAWSYRELACPIYPQERYRLALANTVIERHGLADDVLIRVHSTPNWWTGKRLVEDLTFDELEDRLSRFWWNTRAR